MTNRSFKHAVTAAALMAVTALTPSAHAATTYTDSLGDTLATDAILDIAAVEVSNNTSDLIFKITLNKANVDPNWGKYMVAFDTVPGGDAAGNGWGRPISMSQGMDFWIGTWVDTAPNGQLWNWTGSAWAGGANGSAGVSTNANVVTITVPFANLGLSIGNSFEFDVVSSGGGNDSAIDSLANPSQTVANWGDPYDCSTNDLPKIYTLIQPPDPTNRVTFLVNMQVPIALYDANFSDPNGFDTNADVVYVRGSFNGWATQATNALIQVGPTLFSNTVDVVAATGATISYKFFGSAFPGEETPLLACNAARTLTITNATMTAPTAFWSDRQLTDPSVTVTYSVDMGLQESLGTYTNGVTSVSLRGSFNGWGQLAMTNNPAPDTNILTAVVTHSYTPIGACFNEYKFFYSPPDTWESPQSTAGGNRNFTITSANQVLPTVYWNDQTPCDVLETPVNVTFSIDMTGATGTDATIYDGTQTIYLNGDFLGWWGWGAPGPTNYAMTKNPTSDVHSITLSIAAGAGLQKTYKYSMTGADNEAGFGVNHVRLIRTDAGSTNYSMPRDLWINTNPGASHTETAIGGLVAKPSTPGNVTLQWIGLPCTYMQGSTNINGPYTPLFEARGVSSTNVAVSGDKMYFRLGR